MRRATAALAAVLLAVASPALAQRTAKPATPPKRAATPAPDSVKLRFGWKPGTVMRVESGMSRVNSGARSDSVRIAMQYRLSVLPHAEGMVLRADSFAMPGLTGGDTAQMLQRIVAQLSAAPASYIVDGQGEFGRLEDPARAKVALDSLYAPLLGTMRDAPAPVREMVSRVSSPEVLTAAAEREWNFLVGTWNGADWQVGEVYEVEAMEPSPMLPGVEIPMRYQFGATERTSCAPDADSTRRDCVELRMTILPDSVGLQRVLREFMSKVAPGVAEEMKSMLGGMKSVIEISVVAEPATLRPHLTTQVQRVEVPMPGSPGMASSQETVRWARYRYGP